MTSTAAKGRSFNRQKRAVKNKSKRGAVNFMKRRRFCHTRGLTRRQSVQLLIGKNLQVGSGVGTEQGGPPVFPFIDHDFVHI